MNCIGPSAPDSLALRTPAESFQPHRAEFDARRTFGCERLEAMGLPVARPEAGMFLWVPVWQAGLDGRSLARRLREEEKVAVTPGDLFGPTFGERLGNNIRSAMDGTLSAVLMVARAV